MALRIQTASEFVDACVKERYHIPDFRQRVLENPTNLTWFHKNIISNATFIDCAPSARLKFAEIFFNTLDNQLWVLSPSPSSFARECIPNKCTVAYLKSTIRDFNSRPKTFACPQLRHCPSTHWRKIQISGSKDELYNRVKLIYQCHPSLIFNVIRLIGDYYASMPLSGSSNAPLPVAQPQSAAHTGLMFLRVIQQRARARNKIEPDDPAFSLTAEDLEKTLPRQYTVPQDDPQDDDIAIVHCEIPVRCPIGANVIRTPVRGVNCTHRSCFDLWNFVPFCKQRHVFHCPLCKSSCKPPNELFIDRYFEEHVLSQVQDGSASSDNSAEHPPKRAKLSPPSADPETFVASVLDLDGSFALPILLE